MKTKAAIGLAAAWSLCGCYVTGQVAPRALREAGEGLTGPRLLKGSGSTVMLEPGTMLRARLVDGGKTGWVSAGSLRVCTEGLMLDQPLPAAEVAQLKVRGLDPRELELLRETAPPGGAVEQTWRFSGEHQLKAPGPEAFAWARRFSERALAEGKAGGRWQLRHDRSRARGSWSVFDEDPEVEARNLVEASGPGAAFAPGFRWHEVRELELRSLSPESSALTVPLFPFVVLALWLDSKSFDQATSPTDGEPEGTLPMLTWSDPASRPLFTGRARRRSIIQALATVDAQGTLGGDLATGLGVGMRLRNLFDLALVARGISLMGPQTRSATYALGVAMGLHVDGAGDGRFGFALGMEVGGTPGQSSITSFQLKWGPRLGLGGRLFLTVSPLNVATLTLPTVDGQRSTVGRLVHSLELGGTL